MNSAIEFQLLLVNLHHFWKLPHLFVRRVSIWLTSSEGGSLMNRSHLRVASHFGNLVYSIQNALKYFYFYLFRYHRFPLSFLPLYTGALHVLSLCCIGQWHRSSPSALATKALPVLELDTTSSGCCSWSVELYNCRSVELYNCRIVEL